MADQSIIVEFWDVGQGDCSVLRVGQGRIIVIDVGPRSSPLVDWLNSHHDVFIEAIVLTHNHADHAGALAGVIDAAKGRIGTIYFLDDRSKRDAHFAAVFNCLRPARRLGHVNAVLRLEAPQRIWSDDRCFLSVQFPTVIDNVEATGPNKTAGILTFSIGNKTEIVWASDSLVESVYRTCGSCKPSYLVGPHHGAPEDRAHPETQRRLSEIQPRLNYISVGKNRYSHPQPSYIKKVRGVGTMVMCSQLTSLCDPLRQTDVIKSHARLALPQPNSGVGCRGPVRLTVGKTGLISDGLDPEHQEEIRSLQRPKCITPND